MALSLLWESPELPIDDKGSEVGRNDGTCSDSERGLLRLRRSSTLKEYVICED
jgi:hypothetical protein